MVKGAISKKSSLIKLLVGILASVLLVVLAGLAFQRYDLTEEKRHTLTDSTIELVENLDDIVFVKVYLSGDYPAEYKRLETAVRERLDEMRAYAGDNLEYEFIDPSESTDKDVRQEMYNYLQETGLEYTNIVFETKSSLTEKIIFPGALVTYRSKTIPLQLLKSNERAVDPEMINKSVNNLEYEFSRILRTIISDRTPRIAFVHGHGELTRMETSDAETLLSESYNVSRIIMDGSLSALSDPLDDSGIRRLNKYDLLIVADPTEEIGDADKFHLDQFVMRGGKVMWFIDPINANLDSLRKEQQSMGRPRTTNVEDLLFNYGVRLNNNLVLDSECADIAIVVGQTGNQPQYELLPWYFNPIMTPRSNHPIVNKVDPVIGEFVSTIDIIDRPGISKTVLLTTSDNTRLLRAPVRINLNIVSIDPDFKDKKVPNQNVAVLLEGKFESPLFNLIVPEFNEAGFKSLEESPESSMLVVSDGDLIKNRVSADGQNYFPLGYDRNENRIKYGNRGFLLNAVNYMLDDKGLISVRSRSIKLRKMDAEKLTQQGSLLKMINVGLPILLIIVLGLFVNFFAKRQYRKG